MRRAHHPRVDARASTAPLAFNHYTTNHKRFSCGFSVRIVVVVVVVVVVGGGGGGEGCGGGGNLHSRYFITWRLPAGLSLPPVVSE